MFRDEKLELKVGLFIGIGVFLMFALVFSIKDITLMGAGYTISVVFDFVNGVTEDSPVRLAGVDVGEIKDVELFYDKRKKRTRVKLDVWIKGDTRIEKDASARINTLGLLGEQYLEISPGKERVFLGMGDTLMGHNPLKIGQQMESMRELIASLSSVAKKIERGEGSLGKFIMEDTLYNEMEAFATDIRAHPWKLLSKPKHGRRSEEEEEEEGEESRGTSISTR